MGAGLKSIISGVFKINVCIGLIFVALIIFATMSLYLPGVNGPFLLDDIYNLSPLVYVSDMGGLKGVWYYLGSNTSGVLGRPVALLSFLLNATDWPAATTGFKLTNILLHALCGLFAFWLVSLLFKQSKLESTHALTLAGVAAVIWVVHPINVSTVLYIVQRMTILTTMFGLLALICFVYTFLVKEKVFKVHLLMILGFGGCTVLSVLSKENGALVPLYALVIGSLVFENGRNSLPICRRYLQVLWFFPILLALYFCIKWPSLMSGYEGRDFTLVERLYTQSRLLTDYLSWILIPNKVGATLYFDDYVISKGLFDPISTFYSAISIVLILCCAIYCAFNKKLLLVSVGVAWFFIGHLIESTFIPLEIAFEHRNHMPSIGIIFVLVYCVWALLQRINFVPTRYAVGSFIAVVALSSSLFTSQHVHSWSSWPQLIYTWALDQPGSKRAQWGFADVVAVHGQPDKAIEILEELSRQYPNDLATRINIDVISCRYFGAAKERDWENTVKDFNIEAGAILGLIEEYVNHAKQESCIEITPQKTKSLLALINQHTKVSRHSRLFVRTLFLEGDYLAFLGDYEGSMALMDRASKIQKTVDFPLRQAVISWEFGKYEKALAYIEQAYQRDRQRGWRYPPRRKELEKLESIVIEAVSSKNG